MWGKLGSCSTIFEELVIENSAQTSSAQDFRRLLLKQFFSEQHFPSESIVVFASSSVMQVYKASWCIFHTRGRCTRGSNCSFAHTADELRQLPDLRKTKLCNAFVEGRCDSPLCNYAHGLHELQEFPGKKGMCRLFREGKCTHGARCKYAHTLDELQVGYVYPDDRRCLSSHNLFPSFGVGMDVGTHAHANGSLRTLRVQSHLDNAIGEEVEPDFEPAAATDNHKHQEQPVGQGQDFNSLTFSFCPTPVAAQSSRNVSCSAGFKDMLLCNIGVRSPSTEKHPGCSRSSAFQTLASVPFRNSSSASLNSPLLMTVPGQGEQKFDRVVRSPAASTSSTSAGMSRRTSTTSTGTPPRTSGHCTVMLPTSIESKDSTHANRLPASFFTSYPPTLTSSYAVSGTMPTASSTSSTSPPSNDFASSSSSGRSSATPTVIHSSQLYPLQAVNVSYPLPRSLAPAESSSQTPLYPVSEGQIVSQPAVLPGPHRFPPGCRQYPVLVYYAPQPSFTFPSEADAGTTSCTISTATSTANTSPTVRRPNTPCALDQNKEIHVAASNCSIKGTTGSWGSPSAISASPPPATVYMMPSLSPPSRVEGNEGEVSRPSAILGSQATPAQFPKRPMYMMQAMSAPNRGALPFIVARHPSTATSPGHGSPVMAAALPAVYGAQGVAAMMSPAASKATALATNSVSVSPSTRTFTLLPTIESGPKEEGTVPSGELLYLMDGSYDEFLGRLADPEYERKLMKELNINSWWSE